MVPVVIPEKGIEEATMVPPDIVPVQVKLPVALNTVHPFPAPAPPAISTSPDVSRIRSPVAQVLAPLLYASVSGPYAGWS